LKEVCRASWAGEGADLGGVDSEGRGGAFEGAVVGELSGCDLAEDDAEGEDIGGEIKLFTEQDLGGHVRVCSAEGKATHFVLVASSDASEAKVGDLDATVGGDEEVLALEVTVDAFAGVEVGEGTGDVDGKRETETPGEGFVDFVVYVETNVAAVDEF